MQPVSKFNTGSLPQAVRPVVGPPFYASAPDLDLLTLQVVSASHVTCATSVSILVFLGLYVLDLGTIYAIDVRQTPDAHHRLCPLPVGSGS